MMRLLTRLPKGISAMGICLYFAAAAASGAAASGAEPEFEGKSLSEWLEPTFFWREEVYGSEYGPEVKRALEGMGTNAIPELLRMLGTKEEKGKEVEAQDKQKAGVPVVYRQEFNATLVSRMRALHGLKLLGLRITNAIPEIRRLSMEGNGPAQQILATLDANEPAILYQLLKSMATESKVRVLRSLPDPPYEKRREEMVVILSHYLADASAEVRLVCAETLGRISSGLDEEAVTALERAASDPEPAVRQAAKRVLNETERIERE